MPLFSIVKWWTSQCTYDASPREFSELPDVRDSVNKLDDKLTIIAR